MKRKHTNLLTFLKKTKNQIIVHFHKSLFFLVLFFLVHLVNSSLKRKYFDGIEILGMESSVYRMPFFLRFCVEKWTHDR